MIISNLLCMDDVKCYATSEQNIDSLIHLTTIHSDTFRVSFRPDTSGCMVAKRREVIRTERMKLLEDGIAHMQTESYKYLSILQANGMHNADTIVGIRVRPTTCTPSVTSNNKLE